MENKNKLLIISGPIIIVILIIVLFQSNKKITLLSEQYIHIIDKYQNAICDISKNGSGSFSDNNPNNCSIFKIPVKCNASGCSTTSSISFKSLYGNIAIEKAIVYDTYNKDTNNRGPVYIQENGVDYISSGSETKIQDGNLLISKQSINIPTNLFTSLSFVSEKPVEVIYKVSGESLGCNIGDQCKFKYSWTFEK